MPLHPTHLVRLLGNLQLSKGRWAGQPMEVREFQRDLTHDVFALKPDGNRAIREALVGIGRKNGKTTLTAGWGIGLLILDDEPGGEVVVAAAKRDQARLILNTARSMVMRSNLGGVPLSEFLHVKRDVIYYPELDAAMRVVSADAEKELGANPHAGLFDELGSWPNRRLYDSLTTAMAARDNPISISITTASPQPKGLAYMLYKYGKDVEAGIIDDPQFLLRWWEAAEGRAIDDPEGWAEANPGYPEFPNADYLKRAASTKPEYVFRRLHLNQFTSAHERWLPTDEWLHDLNVRKPEFPDGCEVIMGLDAALSRDTFGAAIIRKDEHGDVHVKVREFRPAGADAYIDWMEVETWVLGMAARYRITRVAYDPAWMKMLAERLEERGLRMEVVPQSPGKMEEAAEAVQRLVLDHRLRHGDDPVLNDAMAGVGIRMTDRGVRISKSRSGDRIDVVVSMAMAVFLLMEPPSHDVAFVV